MIEPTSEPSQAKGEQEGRQQVRHRMSYLLIVAVLETYHTIYFRARGYDFLWPFVHDLCRPDFSSTMVVPLRCFIVQIWIPLGCHSEVTLFSFVFLRDICFFVTSHRVCPHK
jgi:hypothetical protein